MCRAGTARRATMDRGQGRIDRVLTVPDPPCRPGDRVRCGVSTRSRTAPTLSPMPELYGRAGTVVRVQWYTRATGEAYWSMDVAYDHLSPNTWGGDATMPHRAGELVPIADWT